jgi:selenoprotein W-related protein
LGDDRVPDGLRSTFEAELGEVALQAGSGGMFEICVEGEMVWSRQSDGRFPDLPELKRLGRDRVAPGKRLGHSER